MKLVVDGKELEFQPSDPVRIVSGGDRLLVTGADGVTRSALAVRKGDSVLVSYGGRQFEVSRTLKRTRGAGSVGDGDIRAPMPGQVVDVRVAEGDAVVKGQTLLVLEAMKTQQPFSAPFDGKVDALPIVVGQLVPEGARLVKVTASALEP